MTIKIKITKLEHCRHLPEYKTKGASGMDLYAAIDKPAVLKPLERVLIPSGIQIELPEGYEAQVRARSGLAVKHGISLINAIGTIDSDYRGEVCIGLVNLSNEEYTVNPDDRIAQLVIMRIEKAEIEETDELSESARGLGGFGSTGM